MRGVSQVPLARSGPGAPGFYRISGMISRKNLLFGQRDCAFHIEAPGEHLDAALRLAAAY